MEGTLDALGQNALLVDLAAKGGTPFVAGRAYTERDDELLVPLKQYRAVVFLHDSPAMHPLDWPACTPQ